MLRKLFPISIVSTFLLLSIKACLSPNACAVLSTPNVSEDFSSPELSGIGKSSDTFEII